jgi:Enoyl-(Acyl carrier protein) reductase
MTQVASMEMARFGVTVNAVCPTARTRLTETGGRMGSQAEPTGWHLRHPDNIGPFVAFLGSDAAAGITGQVFGVFGGVVQRYDGWTPADVIQRSEPGPWEVEELLARSHELFGASPSAFASRMGEIGALIDSAEASLDTSAAAHPDTSAVRVRG